jgi:hypothetical protein
MIPFADRRLLTSVLETSDSAFALRISIHRDKRKKKQTDTKDRCKELPPVLHTLWKKFLPYSDHCRSVRMTRKFLGEYRIFTQEQIVTALKIEALEMAYELHLLHSGGREPRIPLGD